MNKGKKSVSLLVGCLGSLVLFSACLKTYKMVPSESFQGKDKTDQRTVVADNLRSVRIYDEWQTSALFDVLWLSPETRRAYVDSYCQRRGSDDHAYANKLQEELDESRQYLSFYVLADVRDQFHPSLTDDHAAWTMYLAVEGKKILPEEIKEVDLDPEILSMFGHRFPRPKFKKSYLVKFSADNGNGEPLVKTKMPFTMVISSVAKQCELGWQGGEPVMVKDMKKEPKSKRRKLPKDEDYYWL